MALANALPNLGEIRSQLLWEPDEAGWQYAIHVLLTVGMLASIGLAVASALLFVGLGTTLANEVLGLTMNVPLIGVTAVVPALALAGGVVAALVALQLVPLAQRKENVRDDANAIFLFNTMTYIAAAFNTNLDLPNSVAFAFVVFAVTFALMYVLGVLRTHR